MPTDRYDPLRGTLSNTEINPDGQRSLPPAHQRVSGRWNNLAVADRVTLPKRSSVFVVVARSATDNNRVIVHPEGLPDQLEPVAASTCTLLPPATTASS